MKPFPKDLRLKIIAHLRRIAYLNVDYKAAIARAWVERGKYKCSACGELFKLRDTHGEHTVPVIEPSVGFVDWNTYMERLFLGAETRMCVPCHKIKTKAENEVRKIQREEERWEDV